MSKTVFFTQTADTTLFRKTDNSRLTHREMTYQFKDTGNGKVEIMIKGKMSPLINVPIWMLRKTMPDHPAEVIRKMVNLANEIQ